MSVRSISEVYVHPAYLTMNPEEGRLMTAVPVSRAVAGFEGLRLVAIFPCKPKPFKTLAVFGVMKHDFEAGKYNRKETLVVEGTPDQLYAAASLAEAFGFKRTKGVVLEGTAVASDGSLHVITVKSNTTWRARLEGLLPGHHYLNVRGHMGAVLVHEQYTAPEIHRCLRENALAVAIPMGDGTLASGVSRYFRQPGCSRVTVIGVRRAGSDTTDVGLISAVDDLQEVSDAEACGTAEHLQNWLERSVGLASARAYLGLRNYFGSFHSRVPGGRTVGFLCPDS